MFKPGQVVYHRATFQYFVVIALRQFSEEEKKDVLVPGTNVYYLRGENKTTGNYDFYEFFEFELEGIDQKKEKEVSEKIIKKKAN